MNKDHPMKPCQDCKDLVRGGACMFVLDMFILASVLKRADTTRAGRAPANRAAEQWCWGFTPHNQEVETDRLLKLC